MMRSSKGERIADLIFRTPKGGLSRKEQNEIIKYVAASRESERKYEKRHPENAGPEFRGTDGEWNMVLNRVGIGYQNGELIIYESQKESLLVSPPEIIRDIKVINGTLLKLVEKDPGMMHKLRPVEFETLVAEIFDKKGYHVSLTKQTRDGGKDLIVVENKMLGDFLIYVQCKRNAKDRPVGVNIVRELYGSVIADRATAGILVTSSYFSPDAEDFTSKIKHQMSLADYLKLCEWIKGLSKPK
jgi:HJR/Mrr/RecB family endonuclease